MYWWRVRVTLVLGRLPRPPVEPEPEPGRRWTEAPVLLALALVLIGAVWAGASLRPQPPSESTADVGFSRDMSDHHAQAVAMAEEIRRKTDNPQIRLLATDIALTQQAQIGQMRGWLEAWNQPIAGRGPAMEWMGHGDGTMPGMASQEDLGDLESATGEEADELFLRLMIRHHRGGLQMAAAAIDEADDDDVVRLATAIRDGQAAEIDAMEDLLDGMDARPETTAVTMPRGAGEGSASGAELARFAPLALIVAPVIWLVIDDRRRRRRSSPIASSSTWNSWCRGLLVVAGLAELALAIPALLGVRSNAPGSLHGWRELGAAHVALGAGWLLCAAQPRRAEGLLPVAVALVVLSIGASAVDLLRDQVSAIQELTHVVQLAALGAVAFLARAHPVVPHPLRRLRHE